MEFATEEEMYEILGGNVKYTEYGEYGVVSDERKDTKEIIKNEPVKNFIICHYDLGNAMYVSKNGVTFAKANAKTKAEEKALFMRNKGAYNWQAQRI